MTALLSVAVFGLLAGPAFAGSVPTVSITGGPANGSQIKPSQVTFTFATSPANQATVCQIDGGTWKPCPVGKFTQTVVAIKHHTFQVRPQAGGQAVSVQFDVVPWISTRTYDAGSLLDRAQKAPFDSFKVIVQTKSRLLQAALSTFSKTNGKLGHNFVAIPAINATLPGWAVVALAENTALFGSTTVTEDLPMHASDVSLAPWQAVVEAAKLWPSAGISLPGTAPTIAVVDTGIDPSVAAQFGARLIHSEAFASATPGKTSDGYGHGTFVGSIAAGSDPAAPGVAPTANLVSLKAIDDTGSAYTSDVIAAADWILQNKDTYGIRVANFSLHASQPSSFRYDPLDQAVERLWENGVVVVTASGNFGDGTPQYMAYAPGNDPFVITVGATDTNGTVTTADDTVAPFSAFGRTLDGFAKPDVVAPGRYMESSVPAAAALKSQKPANVLGNTLMRLSGTSFSAPVVAGAAAQILAAHPDWTPDQVKGALMISARSLQGAPALSQGFGEIDVARAAALASAPNPNAALEQYVHADASAPGGYVFDAVSWADAAKSDVSWADVSWADVSWADVSWADVSWADVSWADVSWADVSWADVSWADVSWADASGADVSWADVSWADVSWADVSWAEVSWADNASNE